MMKMHGLLSSLLFKLFGLYLVENRYMYDPKHFYDILKHLIMESLVT